MIHQCEDGVYRDSEVPTGESEIDQARYHMAEAPSPGLAKLLRIVDRMNAHGAYLPRPNPMRAK